MSIDAIPLIDEKIDRSASIDSSDFIDKFVRAAVDMKQPPLSITIDAAGYRAVRILIEDPAEMIAQGQQGVRIDSEISEDRGKTWRYYEVHVFAPGQTLTPKSQQLVGKHYLQASAVSYTSILDASGHEIIQTTPDVFPDGWIFRWHLRQLVPGKIGLSAELEK